MSWNENIPTRYAAAAARMAAALGQHERLLLAAHAHPDGDAIGALAAVGFLLRALDRACLLYVQPGIPQDLAFLNMPVQPITSLQNLPWTPEAVLVLDCGQAQRLGSELARVLPQWPSLNIDHHPGEGLGTLDNWIEPEAAASAQLVAYVALAADVPLKGDLAKAVALGLITDTGGFRHSNTSADVLRLASHLVDAGCDLPGLRERLENTWSLGRMRLWGLLMQRVQILRKGSVAFCAVSLDDLAATHTRREDLEGFVEQLRQLRGTQVAILLRQEARDGCKFSLRSCGSVDVRQAAVALGGGGHRNAAGGILDLDMAQAQAVLLAAVSRELDREQA